MANEIFNTCYIGGGLMTIASYSHIIPIILSLLLGFFVLIKAKFNLFSKVFLLFIVMFSLWLIGDLITWASNNYHVIYTTWSFLDYFEILFYVLGFYFALVFVRKFDISKLSKIGLFILTLPAFYLTITQQSVTGFFQPICEASNNEFLGIYKLAVEGIILLGILICTAIPFIKKLSRKQKRTDLIVLGSMFLFLSVFGITEYIASVTGNYELNLYSLFLLPIFLLVIIYAVFELDIFSFRVLSTQYLVVGLVILMAGQLFFIKSTVDILLTVLTLVITIGLSIILFRNLKKESDQRVHIEKLSTWFEENNLKLEESNKQLAEQSKTLETSTHDLYQHNLELAVKNKTLSLLEKLYQTSILTLTPEEMGQAITDTIREDLNFEFAGILIFEKEKDMLVPLAFSKSERLNETLDKLGFHFRDISIDHVSTRDVFKQVIISQTANMTNKLEDVWKELIKPEHLEEITTQSNIKTILLHPLKTGAEVLGVLILGLNRDYESLNTFEKEAIRSFINMIAVSLDKAYLYQELQDANEKLKSLDKLKTEFLSLASHQLRSPITAIKGYSSMLLEGSYGSISDIQKETADRIFKSSERMNHMIVRFLDVAKIEQGGMQYAMKLFDFKMMVEEIVNELSVTAKERGLTVAFETDNKNPYMVNADREQLWQVVQNLVDNSIKYTKTGGIKVKLSKDKARKKILLSVSDSGMGIKPEILPTLFQKFSRGEGNKMNVEGSGIGLYLAKHVIEDHKGRIWAESEGENKGSNFFIELDDAR